MFLIPITLFRFQKVMSLSQDQLGQNMPLFLLKVVSSGVWVEARTPLPAEGAGCCPGQNRGEETAQVVSYIPHPPVRPTLIGCEP
jgi:hypothetical protein